MTNTKKTEPPQLKNRELARIERLLDEITRPMFVWRMARAKLVNEQGSVVTERLKRVNALSEIAEMLAREGYRRPRSRAGYYMGYTQYPRIEKSRKLRHITDVDDETRTALCGRGITRLITRDSDDEPINLSDYWKPGTPPGDTLCRQCVYQVEKRHNTT
jgi:hypothetical protein